MVLAIHGESHIILKIIHHLQTYILVVCLMFLIFQRVKIPVDDVFGVSLSVLL